MAAWLPLKPSVLRTEETIKKLSGLFDPVPQKILCLGAHCDDIEIGCGASILRLIEANPACEIHWLVFTSSPERKLEAEEAARLFLKNARSQFVSVLDYKDGFLPYLGAEIKDRFEKLKQEFSPDLIFTHYRNDLHQDHRFLCELTWNTFRNHLILEYEIPKYDGDLGSPNVFITVSEAMLEQKIEYLFQAFKSQRSKHWFTPDLFRSLPRLRGMESNSQTTFSEAFYCRKLCI